MIQYLYLGRVGYDEGLRLQAEIAELRLAGRVENVLLLLEHPPVLTLGRNAHRSNILASDEMLARRGVTIHEINRGGDVTYHGPGQLIGYPIFDLRSLRNASGARLGMGQTQTLTPDDADAILKECPAVAALSPAVPSTKTGVPRAYDSSMPRLAMRRRYTAGKSANRLTLVRQAAI